MSSWLIPLIGIAIGVASVLLHDPNKWYGKMVCNRCSYDWQAR